MNDTCYFTLDMKKLDPETPPRNPEVSKKRTVPGRMSSRPHPETPNVACANREGKVGACASDVAESLACVSDVCMCK